MNIRIATLKDKAKWNDFVQETGGSFFHLFEWGEILHECFHYKMKYLIAEEKEKIIGILPLIERGTIMRKRLESLPLADYAGVLSKKSTVSDALFKYLMNGAENKLSVSVFQQVPESHPCKGLIAQSPFCHFELKIDLPYHRLLKEVIPQKTRNMVNKAEREGIITKLIDQEAGSRKQEARGKGYDPPYRQYYDLYFSTMLRLKSLPLPWKFFKILHNKFGPYMRLFLSYKDEHVVSGLLAFVFNKILYIWGNASDQAFLSFGANNAVYASALEYACAHHITTVDFGSTMPDTSHHFFKKRWGGVEKPIYLYGTEKFTADSAFQQRIVGILKFLPKNFLDWLSCKIYTRY